VDTAQPIIILTRPQAQSEAFARRIGPEAEVIISPALEICPLPFSVDLTRYAGLVVTSQNAIAAVRGRLDLAGRTAYAVGERTAAAARAEGMEVVVAGGDAARLVEMIKTQPPGGRLLFLHGVHTRGNVSEQLNSIGIGTDSAVVYDQKEVPLTAEALAALAGERPVILPLFSPRSAAIVGRAARAATAPVHLIAMSAAVRAGWEGPPPASEAVAARPKADEMLREILRRMARRP